MAINGQPKKDGSKPALCFVVGPIGKEGSVERKHADLLLNAVIKHVLEEKEFAYKVKRADEDADPGMIGDRVISDIIHAPLVVADLTDLNPNAFYELGIRHSTEMPTIHVAKQGTALPFDNVAHRTIFVDLTDWHSIEQARSRLAESARAIKMEGYKVSNPITQANASFKMRQSDDPRDRMLATIQERLESLEQGFVPDDSDSGEHPVIIALESLIDAARKQREQGRSRRQILAFTRELALSRNIELAELIIEETGRIRIGAKGGFAVGTSIGAFTDNKST